MVRFVLKGGIWKNTEDEVLKAAVMKYGKNQWSRISSLLVHKTAKQCKARWHEWLDPSIRKTEWTRDEEEKLLHLAKLMPTQWRTIAPLIGRTATQCLEHYNHLLDSAQSRESGGAPSTTASTSTSDPRKLRPGEQEPLPEAKPARPDPVDMDEDEKEMLSEARARLANTKGKKAKRKAREKQLDEARRLAALQKQRELKAAGINIHLHRRIEGMDYNAEIPFHRHAPSGFHEIPSEELRRPEEEEAELAVRSGKVPKSLLIDAENMQRINEEKRKRKEDEIKRKKQESEDMPSVILRENKANDIAEKMRRKAKLLLPSPQITEREVEQIAKSTSEANSSTTTTTSAASTLNISMRTPARTPATRNTLLMEAENLNRLTTSQTPLHGGENVPLLSTTSNSGGSFSSVVRTPNVLIQSVLREQQLLQQGKEKQRETEKARKLAQRKEFEKLLGAIPAPKYKYRVDVPEAKKQQLKDAEEAGDNEELPEDSEDVIAREERAKKRAEEELLLHCSQVMNRGDLPRVLNPNGYPVRGNNDEQIAIERLISEEFQRLVLFELNYFPPTNQPQKQQASDDNDDITNEMIKQAEKLVEEEEQRSKPGNDTKEIEREHSEEWNRCWNDLIFVPSNSRWVRKSKASQKELLEAAKDGFERAKKQLERESMKAGKIDRRVTLYNGGYVQRASAIKRTIESEFDELKRVEIELNCFNELHQNESNAIRFRAESLRKLIEEQRQIEENLQQRYSTLLSQVNAKNKK